jgi:hypothetical protein
MSEQLEKIDESIRLDQNYKNFLLGVKERLKAVQIKAALAANSELVKFYWRLGADLIDRQKAFKWGESFLEQFSHDMCIANPGMQGFSVRNLYRMKKFVKRMG